MRVSMGILVSIIVMIVFLAAGAWALSPLFMEPDVNVVVDVKKQVMSAVYKVYGNPDFQGGSMWLARTVIHNVGPVAIYNIKVSYKIEISGLTFYRPEWTEPKTYVAVLPGGTLIDRFYPTFPSEILTLTTTSPAKLYVKYEYTAPGGKKYTETKSYSFDLLARNEIVYTFLTKEEYTGSWYDRFTNYWAIAAWVTPNERVLRDFVGHYVHGFAPITDQQAMAMWLTAYEAINAYGIRYMFTPTSPWDSKEAYQITQVVKFPKDTIESKAGTCIELSILMASIAEAYSVKAYILLIPGHAIPIIRLPQSGQLVPIESTKVGELPAQQAVQFALKEIQMVVSQGWPYILIDIEYWWHEGVIPPE